MSMRMNFKKERRLKQRSKRKMIKLQEMKCHHKKKPCLKKVVPIPS